MPQEGAQRRVPQEGDVAKKKIPAPEGLKDTGSAMWAGYVKDYEFRPDELRWLETACRATDRLEVMDSELRAMGYIIQGSMGQDMLNPLVGEIRATEAHRDNALKRLGIPDDVGAPVSNFNQHRSAANSKWATAYGKGA